MTGSVISEVSEATKRYKYSKERVRFVDEGNVIDGKE